MKTTEFKDRMGVCLSNLTSFLKTNEGANALLYLTTKYSGNVVENDPYNTYRRIGEKNVVEFLQSLRDE